MIQILTAYGEEKIRDCLQENLDSEKGNGEQQISVTYGDTIKDEDLERPRDVVLTVSDDFGCQQRLDYIFEMDLRPSNSNTRLEIDVS